MMKETHRPSQEGDPSRIHYSRTSSAVHHAKPGPSMAEEGPLVHRIAICLGGEGTPVPMSLIGAGEGDDLGTRDNAVSKAATAPTTMTCSPELVAVVAS